MKILNRCLSNCDWSKIGSLNRGRHERYPGTHGYPSKFKNLGTGYRENFRNWVPLSTGYQGNFRSCVSLGTGYRGNFRWVLGTGQIFNDADPWVIFKFIFELIIAFFRFEYVKVLLWMLWGLLALGRHRFGISRNNKSRSRGFWDFRDFSLRIFSRFPNPDLRHFGIFRSSPK